MGGTAPAGAAAKVQNARKGTLPTDQPCDGIRAGTAAVREAASERPCPGEASAVGPRTSHAASGVGTPHGGGGVRRALVEPALPRLAARHSSGHHGRDAECSSGFAARFGCGQDAAEMVPLLDGALLAETDAEGKPHPAAWRALLALFGGVAFLGVAIEPIGLVPAVAGAVLIAGFAEPRPPRPLPGALLVAATAALGWLVFGA